MAGRGYISTKYHVLNALKHVLEGRVKTNCRERAPGPPLRYGSGRGYSVPVPKTPSRSPTSLPNINEGWTSDLQMRPGCLQTKLMSP